MEIVEIRCSGCGMMRKWRGYECLTFCDCLADKPEDESNLLDVQVSLPCIFGQHNWVDTGNETKIWSDNKTDSLPPEDCYTQKEQKCLLCGQIRSKLTTP